MRYDTPELSERLAADYVLGTMPRRARDRFERALGRDATLAARVARWAERFKPLDNSAGEEMPPARVWRAIERRIEATQVPARRKPWFAGFTAWQAIGAIAAPVCALVVLYVAINPVSLPRMASNLIDRTGVSGWVAAAPPPDVGLSLVSIGISTRERPRWLRAALLITNETLPLTVPPPR